MTADAPPTFTAWLDGHLTRRGWLQKDLARRLGITDAHMSRIRSGIRTPTEDQCVLMAQLFNESLATVFAAAGRTVPSTEPPPKRTEDIIEEDPRFTRAQKMLLLGIIASWVGADGDSGS